MVHPTTFARLEIYAMSTETFSFKSEAKQLLNLMIHSLYSTKDIFLRELISNASDALDKRRFEALTDSALAADEELQVWVKASDEDAETRTLTIRDNGIGMSRDEMIENLGTIARSGTKEFIAKMKESKEQGDVEHLIGQFGVGFYSSFIAAERVEVTSRRAGSDEAWRWSSTGEGEYSIEQADSAEVGTSITMFLRDANEEDGLEDFTKEWTLRSTIKRYSDFVQHPIQLWTKKSEPYIPAEGEEADDAEDKEPTVTWEWETANSMKAIWSRDPSEVTDDEYNEFYKHFSKDWVEPAERLRFKVEGNLDFTALLFVPSKRPHDLFYREQDYGLQLYANRVMIKESAEELLPTWLRFMKGVVESRDLSLNVSREMLQQDRHVKAIRKQVINKTVKHLKGLLADERERYEDVWGNFGEVLKESVVDYEFADKVKPLLLFKSSTEEGLTTLDEYIERMGETQEAIYYLVGESLEGIKRSPHLEAFTEKGIEVLFLDQPIDEYLVDNLHTYEGKKLSSVAQGDVELGSEEEREEAEKALKEDTEASQDLLTALKGDLDEHIKEVRLSQRLTSSPACLVADEGAMSPQMLRMMEQMGQAVPKSKRILELNPKHPLFERLKAEFSGAEGDNSERLKHFAQIIYGQALIAEGSPLSDPAAFTEALTQVMVEA